MHSYVHSKWITITVNCSAFYMHTLPINVVLTPCCLLPALSLSVLVTVETVVAEAVVVESVLSSEQTIAKYSDENNLVWTV